MINKLLFCEIVNICVNLERFQGDEINIEALIFLPWSSKHEVCSILGPGSVKGTVVRSGDVGVTLIPIIVIGIQSVLDECLQVVQLLYDLFVHLVIKFQSCLKFLRIVQELSRE